MELIHPNASRQIRWHNNKTKRLKMKGILLEYTSSSGMSFLGILMSEKLESGNYEELTAALTATGVSMPS